MTQARLCARLGSEGELNERSFVIETTGWREPSRPRSATATIVPEDVFRIHRVFTLVLGPWTPAGRSFPNSEFRIPNSLTPNPALYSSTPIFPFRATAITIVSTKNTTIQAYCESRCHPNRLMLASGYATEIDRIGDVLGSGSSDGHSS